jgi:hypothetical protein
MMYLVGVNVDDRMGRNNVLLKINFKVNRSAFKQEERMSIMPVRLIPLVKDLLFLGMSY